VGFLERAPLRQYRPAFLTLLRLRLAGDRHLLRCAWSESSTYCQVRLRARTCARLESGGLALRLAADGVRKAGESSSISFPRPKIFLPQARGAGCQACHIGGLADRIRRHDCLMPQTSAATSGLDVERASGRQSRLSSRLVSDPIEFSGFADERDAATTGGMAGLATRSTKGVLPEPGKVCGIRHDCPRGRQDRLLHGSWVRLCCSAG